MTKRTQGRLSCPTSTFVDAILFRSTGHSEKRITKVLRMKEETKSMTQEFIIVTMKTEQNDKFYLRLDQPPSNTPSINGSFLNTASSRAVGSVTTPTMSAPVCRLTFGLAG